jgi:fructose-1,6-bisphosphatase II
MLYAIGGAPEGIISAALVRAMNGDMQARLIPRNKVEGKGGDTPENLKIAETEITRCNKMGVEVEKTLELHDMVRTDHLIVSITGVTKGDLLNGVVRNGDLATTETLLIRGHTRTIRRINSTHFIKYRSPEMQKLIL